MAAPAKVFYGTGRRKSSSARVFLKSGSGKFTINGKKPEEYLHHDFSRTAFFRALDVTNNRTKIDARVTVKGGGETGQSEAISLGIARALVAMDATLRDALKEPGLLTRDPRMVERKKYGLRGARRRGQYSKR